MKLTPNKSDSYATPDFIYDLIKLHFGKTKEELYDPCPLNPIGSINALKARWKDWNYVNPPYTKKKEFVLKALREYFNAERQTIMLLPSNTDQDWFHLLIEFNFKIIWIKKRVKFKHCRWSSQQTHFLVLIGDT